MKESVNNLEFLTGGGEMGALIRAKDWSKTPLGDTGSWSRSLLTTLSIIINSRFPMFLFWGPQLICFYNDAYRPSLGKEGKHPNILGGRGEDQWKEIWSIIGPMIDKALTNGESTFSANQLIPIYRNGSLEDVYWTFSYSPVNDESGIPAGVFVTCEETTANVVAFKKIEESEERFRTMAENTEILIAIGDETSNAIYFNKAWVELTGRPMEELLEFGWVDLVHPEDKERYVNIYLEAFAKQIPFTGEFRVLNKEGQYRSLLAKAPPRFNSDGSFAGFISSCMDITELNESKEKIRISEHRFHAAVNAVDGVIWTNNPQGQMEGEQPGWASITGQSYEEYQGYGWATVVHPEDSKPTIDAWSLAVENKSTFVFSHRLKTINGTWRDFSIRAVPILNDHGNIREWVGMHTDITEEKKYQLEISESEQKFRLLSDSMPQFIWTGDADGNLNYFNRSVFDYSGLTIEEINKDGWIQIVHPDEREENVKAWTLAVSTGKDFLFEHRFRNHHGEYRWQLSRAIPQKDENGKVQMWVGTSTDIQDQKTFANKLKREVHERTKELEQKNIDLEKMNNELQSFAYISSHDLQEPLRKIQTFSSQIFEKEYDNLSGTVREKFHRIQNAAERMQTLIRDLLIYSRTNNSERKFENTDLNKIVKEVKEDLREELELKNATIEATQLCEIHVIAFQFRQLIYNLISNSLKFSGTANEPLIKIKSRLMDGADIDAENISKDKTYCHITISDNGIGFEPQYSEKIFQVFQRLHGKSEYDGTGIGLAIVKKIIDNHNGVIVAKGELNIGATFEIFIPDQQ